MNVENIAPFSPIKTDPDWQKIGIEEKLDLLRSMVYSHERHIKDLEHRLGKMQNHSHLEGRLVVPLLPY